MAKPDFIKALIAPPVGKTDLSAQAYAMTLSQYQTASIGRSLPRPADVFDAPAFGPQQPIQPFPVDRPTDRDTLEPRIWQYPVSWNLPVPPRAFEPVSFDLLRAVARYVDIVRRAIEVRKNEVANIDWDIVLRDDEMASVKGRDFLADEKKKIRDFFQRPDPIRGLTFHSWVRQALEEVLVVDALSIFPHRTVGKKGGVLGSDLMALEILDGSTVKPLLDHRGTRPLPPAPAYQQFLWGIARSELVAPREGDEPVAQYEAEELLYLPYVTRAESPWGFPPVEACLQSSIIWFRRQQWWQSWFTESDMPAMFMFAAEGTPADEIERMNQALHGLMAGDPGWRHRIKIIPFGTRIDQVKPAVFDHKVDEFWVRVLAMNMDVTPTELGFAPERGLGGKGFGEEQSAVGERKSLRPLLRWLEDQLSHVIATYIGQPELAFRFVGLEYDDQKLQGDLDKIYLSVGVRTVNEVREARGWDPLDDAAANIPIIETASGPVPLSSVAPPAPTSIGLPPSAGATGGVPANGAASDLTPPGGAVPEAETGGKPPEQAAEGEIVSESKLVDGKPPIRKIKSDKVDGGIYRGAGHTHTTVEGHIHAHEHDDYGWHTHEEHQHEPMAAEQAKELGLFGKFAQARLGKSRRPFEFKHVAPHHAKRLNAAVSADEIKAATNAAKAQAMGDAAAAALADLAQQLEDGDITEEEFVEQGGDILSSAYGDAYELGGGGGEWADEETAKARGYLGDFATAIAAGMTADAIAARADLYGGRSHTAFEAGKAEAAPDGATITWHTSDDDKTCDNCKALDGQTFTEETLPGFPGDGDFDDSVLCFGGVNCRCYLTYEAGAEA